MTWASFQALRPSFFAHSSASGTLLCFTRMHCIIYICILQYMYMHFFMYYYNIYICFLCVYICIPRLCFDVTSQTGRGSQQIPANGQLTNSLRTLETLHLASQLPKSCFESTFGKAMHRPILTSDVRCSPPQFSRQPFCSFGKARLPKLQRT